jgi:hypothetical protein
MRQQVGAIAVQGFVDLAVGLASLVVERFSVQRPLMTQPDGMGGGAVLAGAKSPVNVNGIKSGSLYHFGEIPIGPMDWMDWIELIALKVAQL